MMTLDRPSLCALLVERILAARSVDHPTRVAIDGPDCAGKTTLADELAQQLAGTHPVIRLSVDHFHRPAAERSRRGALSPEGYYFDSFDHRMLIEEVLRPLSSGGDRRYRPAGFDHINDERVDVPRAVAQPHALVLFDGVFLLRPELRDHWDLSIYLDVPPEESLRRARERDVALFGSIEALETRYRRRYLPGQVFYRADSAPRGRADLLVDLTALERPTVVRDVH